MGHIVVGNGVGGLVSDMWHFSDFGHAILAQSMATRLALMLSRRGSVER